MDRRSRVARGAGRSRSSLGRGYASRGKPSTCGVVLYGRCRALWALRGKPSVLLDLWLGVVAPAICWVELFDLSGVSHLRILGSSDVSRHVTTETRCVSNEVRTDCRPLGPQPSGWCLPPPQEVRAMDLALGPAPRGEASTSGRMYGDRIPAGPRDPSLWSDSSITTQMDPIWP